MCKKLLNISRQIMSVVTICIIMLSFIFSPYFLINIYANNINRPQQTDNAENENQYTVFSWDNFFDGLMLSLGVAGDFSSSIWDGVKTSCKSLLVGENLFDNGDGTVKCLTDSSGNIIVTADMLLQLRNLIEQEMKSKEPYTIYYPGSSKVYYEHYSARFPTDGTSYVAFRKYFDTFGAFGQPNSSWDLFDAIDFAKFRYAYLDRGYISFVDKELNSTLPVLVFGIGGRWLNNCTLTEYSLSSLQEKLGANNAVWSAGYNVVSADTVNNIYKCARAGYNGVFCGQPIQVFNSLNDLYDYVNSKPIAYYTTDYYNKTYQDITLNQDIIKNYTTENVQNIYNTINNNADDALTQDELQKIIDSTVTGELEKINSSLDDVNKGLDGVNENLNDIKQEVKTSNNWLEKIYDRLGDIYTLLVDGYMFENEQETDDMFNSYMGADNYAEMVTIFLYGITTEQYSNTESMVMLYDNMSAGLADDSDIYNISGYSYDFYAVSGSSHSHESGTAIRVGYGGIVGHMAHKFPFCIPFDIYDMARLFAGEPETPYFSIPFHVEELNFDYEIVVDLSGFDMLSRFSRSITTLLMVYGIIVFTKKNIIG